jgi:hypothetical protein
MMNNFMNKIFNGLHMNDTTKDRHKPTASHNAAGIIQDMPENVLFGEDSGAIPPEEFKNQLEDEIFE